MVFLGTCSGKVFGVKFVQGIMNSRIYQRHVKYVCVPQLKDLNDGTLDGITWQQDGANIHRNPAFMDYLEETFDGQVLALGADYYKRRGHSWAPRSPDLSVLDFAIWPILKSKVFLHPRPNTLEDLEAKILQVIEEVNQDPDLIRQCHLSVRKRADLCFANFGKHFEFLQ